MAKFRCVCGEILQTSGQIPNPIQWLAWPDTLLATRFSGMVDAEEIYLAAILCFKCPRSGHLWWFWAGMDQPPTCHAPVGTGPVPGAATDLVAGDATGWKVMSDEAFDEVQGTVSGTEVTEMALTMRRSRDTSRLWVLWDGADEPVSCYSALPTGWDPLDQDSQ